jgi:hypothetical protein
MVVVPFLVVSVAYMVEGHSFGDLDIRSVGIAVKPLAVCTDVEIAAREPVLVQLDLPGAAHVHEVFIMLFC